MPIKVLWEFYFIQYDQELKRKSQEKKMQVTLEEIEKKEEELQKSPTDACIIYQIELLQ